MKKRKRLRRWQQKIRNQLQAARSQSTPPVLPCCLESLERRVLMSAAAWDAPTVDVNAPAYMSSLSVAQVGESSLSEVALGEAAGQPDLVVSDLQVDFYTEDWIQYDFTVTNVGDGPANLDGPTGASPRQCECPGVSVGRHRVQQ